MALTDYSFGLDEIVFDGAEGSTETYRLLQFQGLERSVRDQDAARPGDHGIVMAGTDLLSHRVLQLDVLIRATPVTLQSAIDVLSRAWGPRSDEIALAIKLPGVGERFVKGRPRRFGVSPERWGKGYAKAALEFVCSTPYIFGTEHILTTTIRSSLSGGLTFTAGTFAVNGHPGPGGMNPTNGTFAVNGHPGPVGVSFTVGTTDGELMAPNLGSFTAPWTIRLNGPLTTPSLIHLESNREIKLRESLAAGQVLVLTSVDHTVTLNGDNRYSWLRKAEWFDLVPGQNNIRLFGSSGDTGTATISYNDTYT